MLLPSWKGLVGLLRMFGDAGKGRLQIGVVSVANIPKNPNCRTGRAGAISKQPPPDRASKPVHDASLSLLGASKKSGVISPPDHLYSRLITVALARRFPAMISLR